MSIIDPEGSIGVYDLKNQLSAVLDNVLGGREVTVTKHGRPIARIAPIAAAGRAERVAAISALHALGGRVRRSADDVTVRELIDESFVREACELLDNLDIGTDVVGVPGQRLALEAHATGLTANDTCYLLLVL